MSKNILIYLFGAWTASSIWGWSTGVINPATDSGIAVPFALFSLAAYIGTLFGLVAETLRTLDKDE